MIETFKNCVSSLLIGLLDVLALQMFFEWSTDVTILFEPWVTRTWYFYTLSCIGVAVMAVGLEWLRSVYHQMAHSEDRRLTKLRRFGESLLYGGYIVMSYLVMLVVMTYNVGLCLAILVGYVLGHYLFPRGGSVAGVGSRGRGQEAMYAPVSATQVLDCH